jgi:hypothetical protein
MGRKREPGGTKSRGQGWRGRNPHGRLGSTRQEARSRGIEQKAGQRGGAWARVQG